MTHADFTALDAAGLNLQAVFDIETLPVEIRDKLRSGFDPQARYRQLILVGHAGRALWECVKAAGQDSPDPIDDFSAATVRRWFAERHPQGSLNIIFPGDSAIDLLALGRLAGWHHPSPFMIGIQRGWGTWFAYRVVALADTELSPTAPLAATSPCASCTEKPCLSACPAGAPALDGFALDKCVGYRRQADSACRETCLSRIACPVGAEHRYAEDQLRHTYRISLEAIETYC